MTLEAFVDAPDADPVGAVVFAHGSGSSRHSTRNQHVAGVLRGHGLTTVLLDLLTPGEERVDRVTREHRFDIPLLAERVVGAVDWWGDRSPVGLFGASTGAAAALVAASRRTVTGVVSRGGRPDLAADALGEVEAPTLLIVGGDDHTVIDLNRQAMAAMTAPVSLEIVPGAGHLFEEPGALDRVAELAAGWFRRHMEA
ncbi:MAG: alpha/beta family hydrolase [Acidimicrobiia bacterium]|nr:alpha/beta family hydrolase [Acidimicrobiia bacterium]